MGQAAAPGTPEAQCVTHSALQLWGIKPCWRSIVLKQVHVAQPCCHNCDPHQLVAVEAGNAGREAVFVPPLAVLMPASAL